MQVKFSGKLVYNDLAEFEVHSDNGFTYNISNIFKKIAGKARPYINITVLGMICEIFEGEGILYEAVELSGLKDWHINGVPIANRLFNHVDEYVDAVIDAEIELGDEEVYETNEL